MKLVYMWIDKYRKNKEGYLVDNMGLNFHHKYRFEFDGKDKLKFSTNSKNDYIDSYYKQNQYYSMLVGKNGSGKSSIFELLYNGVNKYYDAKTKQRHIENRFIAIFLDNDKFLFYGFEINSEKEIFVKDIKELNKINLNIEYIEHIENLKILCINADFGELETIITRNEVSNDRIKISDNIKKKEATTSLLNGQQTKITNSLSNSSFYERVLNYYKNDFTQSFLLNYKNFKKIEDKGIELPLYFYFKFNPTPKEYYKENFDKLIEKSSDETKEFLENLSQSLYKYYDFVYDTKLSIFQKIKAFYIFYYIDKYLFHTSDINVIIDTFTKSNTINKIKSVDFENIDNLYTYEDNIHFNPFGEIWILEDIIRDIQNTYHKVIDNTIVVNRFENETYMRNLAGSVDSFKEIFTLGQIYLTYDFYPILSSGHLQLFKIFNYILEGVREFIKNGDSYEKDVLILLDEPDSSLHYEWQRNFIKWLSEFLEQFDDFNFHININTHSGMMLSDIPKENVVVLNREKNKTFVKDLANQTLAQNLFENLNSDFFLDKFIGGYIEDKILEIVKKENLDDNEKKLIQNLGEEVLRVSLKMKYDIKEASSD